MKNFFNTNYHPKLIEIMGSSTGGGVFAANIVGPLIAAFAVYDFLPHTEIYIWLSLHLIIFLARVSISKSILKDIKLLRDLNTNKSVSQSHLTIDNKKMNKSLKYIYAYVISTGFLYNYLVFKSISYEIPDLNIFVIAIVMFSLSVGAISTLVSVYNAFLLFMFSSITPLIGALLYHGGEMFYAFALVMSVFLGVFVISGHKQYNLLRNTILLEEEKEQLNKDLEYLVQEELSKNREKDRQLLSQSRHAQMGEMISMIAHQWRQPLASISSTSSTIQLKAELDALDNDTAIRLSNNISGFAQHLSTTINDFRDFFKPNKEKVETRYSEIIKSVLSIVEVSIKNKNIEIVLDLNSDDKFSTYTNEIKQVLLNLIKNAEDVLLEKKVENPFIKIKTYKDANLHILEVSDNGGGIPKDIIDNIFNPYFSTKTKKNGTGLGLYMSKTIIEDHCRGEIVVSNGVEGAEFKIVLF